MNSKEEVILKEYFLLWNIITINNFSFKERDISIRLLMIKLWKKEGSSYKIFFKENEIYYI
jgi:hypothetical protein